MRVAVTRPTRRRRPGRHSARTDLLADRSGSSAIEFALIGPLFLLVLFAVFDLARLVFVMATMEFAAQEGARFASLRGSSSLMPATNDQVSNRVRSFIKGIDADAVSVGVSWSPDASSGSTVAINTGYEHKVLMGLLPIPPVALNGRASLVIM